MSSRGSHVATISNFVREAVFRLWQTNLSPKTTDRSGIADPLSAPEGAILNLIAQGLSNKKITRDLAIAPETVKSHVKHIFIKLGVEKRAQAVARAQSLGLVTTH